MREIICGESKVTLDEGIFFGKGVFETILWEKKPIFLKEHIERLKLGMRRLGLDELEEITLYEFLDKLDCKYEVIKILVTPKNIIITRRKNNYNKEDYKKGFSLKVSSVRRNSTSSLCYIKSINYIENIIEKNKVVEDGYNDVLFLNENNMITETSCANIFIVKNNIVTTPRVKCGLLNGIMRDFVINNFKVKEIDIALGDIEVADEVFITNSVVGVMPIVRIDEASFSIGNMAMEVAKKYDKVIVNLGGK